MAEDDDGDNSATSTSLPLIDPNAHGIANGETPQRDTSPLLYISLGIGIILFIVGLIVGYLLFRDRKSSSSKAKKTNPKAAANNTQTETDSSESKTPTTCSTNSGWGNTTRRTQPYQSSYMPPNRRTGHLARDRGTDKPSVLLTDGSSYAAAATAKRPEVNFLFKGPGGIPAPGGSFSKTFTTGRFSPAAAGSSAAGSSTRDQCAYQGKQQQQQQQGASSANSVGNSIGGTWILPGNTKNAPKNSALPATRYLGIKTPEGRDTKSPLNVSPANRHAVKTPGRRADRHTKASPAGRRRRHH